MKVLVDAHMLGTGEGGNERYIANLVRAARNFTHVTAFRGSTYNLYRYIWEIPRYFYAHTFDVVHSTYFPVLFTYRSVVIIHDLLFRRYPAYLPYKKRLQFSLMPLTIFFARQIVVPSQFTAKELITYYPGAKNKITVIPEAADPLFHPLSQKIRKQLRNRYDIRGNAYITFGSAYPKRQPYRFVRPLLATDPSATLFVIGSPPEDREKFHDFPDLRFLTHISDKKLNELYNLATAVLYHSEYEGFGLPILEAFASRVPAVISDIPVFREVGGDAPYYFENGSDKSLTTALRKLMRDPVRRKAHVSLGKDINARFSWEMCARQTIAVWQKVMTA